MGQHLPDGRACELAPQRLLGIASQRGWDGHEQAA